MNTPSDESDIEILAVEELTPEEEHQRMIRVARAHEAMDLEFRRMNGQPSEVSRPSAASLDLSSESTQVPEEPLPW